MSEKTEQPSGKRLRDARRKGQLPRSRVLSAAAVTLGALVGWQISADGVEQLRGWMVSLFSTPDREPAVAMAEALGLFVRLALPPLIGATLAGGGLAVAFAGFEFHSEAVMPQLERVNPAAGLKRLFSVRSVVEVAKALGLALVLVWLFRSRLIQAGPQAFRAIRGEGVMAVIGLFSQVERFLWTGLSLLVALGAADYLLSRWRHVRDLMMTREEVKREHKESEGDPHQKGKRKALHQQLAAGGRARGVQKATAVVVNPTHIAVALRYSPEECDAPYLVAKGREEDALALRREAKRLGIPVIKDIPFARSLIHYDVGEEIPEELYRAAAAILKAAMASANPDEPSRRET